jgi:hypothetical protein
MALSSEQSEDSEKFSPREEKEFLEKPLSGWGERCRAEQHDRHGPKSGEDRQTQYRANEKERKVTGADLVGLSPGIAPLHAEN